MLNNFVILTVRTEVNHILEDVGGLWSVFGYLAHNIERWDKLSNVFVRIVASEEGNNGDTFVKE